MYILPAFCFHGYIAQHKKRNKIVATRHDFWAQNVPKMLLWPGLRPEPRWGSSQRSSRPPSWIWGRFAAGKGEELDGKGLREREGKRKYRDGRKGNGRRGGKEGKGRHGTGRIVVIGGLTPLFVADNGWTWLLLKNRQSLVVITQVWLAENVRDGCANFVAVHGALEKMQLYVFYHVVIGTE